jgi:AcrR family transcriptional regulator
MTGRGAKGSAKRTLLLDAAETLIVDEGYAAVSTRRVGLEAGVQPSLVHYYFPTTEDLLMAVYERAAERAHARAIEALSTERPLEAFWQLSKDSAHTALGTEFYALANHRKMIQGRMAETAVAFRTAQAEALASALGDETGANAMALVLLVTGMSRILVMEEATGVTTGHAELRAMIDTLLQSALDSVEPNS